MTEEQPHPNAIGRGWQAFRTWRRARPFWAGVFSILAAGPILYAPYAALNAGDVTVQLQQFGGVSALFIGAILIMCGIAIWFNPQARVYLGVFVILVSLVSFIVATFGGFGVGMLFGLIGGTLAVSWVYLPPDAPDDEHVDDDEGGEGGEGGDGDRGAPDDTLVEDGFLVQAMNGKDADASGEAPTGSVTNRPGDSARGSVSPRTALTVIATAMVGVVGVVGIAHASPSDPLPDNPYSDGPCVSASPTTSSSASAAPSTSSAAPSTTATKSAGSTPAGKAGSRPSTDPTAAADGRVVAPKAPQGTAAQTTAPTSKAPEFRLPELKLPELKLPELKLPGLPGLGLPGADRPSTAPPVPASAPPAAPASAAPPAAAAGRTPSAPASTPPATTSGKPSAKPSTTSAKPSATSSSAVPKDGRTPFPCPVQGPVNAKSGGGLPPVAVDPLVLKSSLLAMAGLNYEGVVKVETLAGGEENALKFTVSKGIDIWNMSMTVKEAGGKDVVISSDEGSKSWMDADIPTTMYVKYLKGNIFGIIPITFTPESPPPINVPIVFFTNVESAMYAQLGGKLHIPGYGINKTNVK
ncbi:DUF6114 domain-containing protein [Embleya sp. NPDC005971]|uniref:DUF6114 domain-containing protein n=1 Tax=Embleya sp. NPDC005971 TaxID=3156724 RepID=UPI0033E24B83